MTCKNCRHYKVCDKIYRTLQLYKFKTITQVEKELPPYCDCFEEEEKER